LQETFNSGCKVCFRTEPYALLPALLVAVCSCSTTSTLSTLLTTLLLMQRTCYMTEMMASCRLMTMWAACQARILTGLAFECHQLDTPTKQQPQLFVLGGNCALLHFCSPQRSQQGGVITVVLAAALLVYVHYLRSSAACSAASSVRPFYCER
jgi:hypothetical protein